LSNEPPVPLWQTPSGPPQPPPEGLWQAPPLPGLGWNYAPPQRRGRAPAVAAIVIIAVVIVAVIGGLAYLGSQLAPPIGRSNLPDLAVGQCFNGARVPTGTTIVVNRVEVVDCTAPHTSELIANFDYPGASSAVQYPGEPSIDAYTQQECVDRFADYIGLSINESIFVMTYFYPTEANWVGEDYSIQCIVQPPAGQRTAVESYRNAAR
jgi:hypothetical protein